MDLRLLSGVGAASASTASAARAVQPAAGARGTSFATALDSALKSVNDSQLQADALQRQYQLGSGSVSLEETMVSMQKAQIGFQAALTVRNRLVSAYTDIMNMQV